MANPNAISTAAEDTKYNKAAPNALLTAQLVGHVPRAGGSQAHVQTHT